MGTEFIWWMGVVEDRGDPLQLGRVRVRCYGFHSQSKSDTPTDNLPWAQPIQSITSAAMGDVGHTALGLVEGTWVVGFFLDGKEAQRPVIMGSISAIPSEAGDPSQGFNDPTGRTKENNLSVWESHSEDQPYVSRYPRGTTLPAENYSEANEEFKTGEKENDRLRPDTNRLARNASHPVLASKDNAALTGVMIAHGDQTLRDEFEELPRGYADGEARDAGLDIYGNKEKKDDKFLDAAGNYPTMSGKSTGPNAVPRPSFIEENEFINDKNAHPIPAAGAPQSVDASGNADSINPIKYPETDFTKEKWDEPKTTHLTKNTGKSRYSTSYPLNHVFESESGHIKEYDDTPDATRIHEYHRSGTFYEIDHDGTKHIRVVGNNYEVVHGTNFVNIKGDVNLTIESNCKTYIKGDWNIQVDGNKHETIKGNSHESILGDQVSFIKGSRNETVETNVIETYGTEIDKNFHTKLVTGSTNETVLRNVTETYGTDTSKHAHTTTVNGSHSETIASSQTSSVTGSVTENYSSNLRTDIAGTTGIKHGGVATYHYVDDFKEKIDRDHYVDKEGGKVDHNHPIIPARTSALTEVEGL